DLIHVLLISAFFVLSFSIILYFLKNSKPDTNGKNEIEKDVVEFDETKVKEINLLRANEKFRKEFLGNISHELKTPIFNIQGYILTLLEGGLEDPSINMEYLERTEKSINRMISIVSDLEEISKIEAGEFQLNYEDFNIIRLIEEVFEQEEIRAQKKNVSLRLAKKYEYAIMVHADKKGIFEVLSNLIINGINYGKDEGSVRVNILAKDNKVLIEVSDDGIGIPRKHLPRIFERFYRVDKSRSRDEGGTGLGLAIVKHFIEAHGQNINISSTPGKGTTFTFSLNRTNK
ncbi:sensor histidine kinase, partial [Bacteroidota bacterium]